MPSHCIMRCVAIGMKEQVWVAVGLPAAACAAQSATAGFEGAALQPGALATCACTPPTTVVLCWSLCKGTAGLARCDYSGNVFVLL